MMSCGETVSRRRKVATSFRGNKERRERVVRMRMYMEELRIVRVEGSRANIRVDGVYLQIEIPEKVSSDGQILRA